MWPIGFFVATGYISRWVTIATRSHEMSSREEPKNAAAVQEPELESTDGGWDPYIASLLMSGRQLDDGITDDEDQNAPVMSFSNASGNRGAR